MKLIKAIIQPVMLEEVKEALEEFGLTGMTVYEARGSGTQKGKYKPGQKDNKGINLLPKSLLEIVVEDTVVDKVVEVIARAARTGAVGDGKVFVYPVESALRIRTGEKGEVAIK